MELSGTIHLHEASNNRYQFIYGSIKNTTFFGVYAQFTVENKTLKKVTLRSVNYNEDSRLGITNMTISAISNRTGIDYGARNNNTISINCIGISLDMQEMSEEDNPVLERNNLNIPLTEDLYLEVTRNPDRRDVENLDADGKIVECKESFLPDGQKMVKSTTAPGGICPRGYSKILIT